jgi:hypothetical protein
MTHILRKSHFLVHDDSEIVYGAHLIEHGLDETFHLSGKTLVTKDLLKRRDSGLAKADEQFFKMIGGMPSGPEPLLTPKSCKTLSNSFEVN